MAGKNVVPIRPKDAEKHPSGLKDTELRFVDEFMADRDPYGAASRAGVARINLGKRVESWMGNQGILKEIQRRTDATPIEKMITPQRIVAGFIDVAFDKTANHSARNAALKELAALNKLYEDDDAGNGSGVIHVPMSGSPEQWRKMALESQTKLKKDVRD